MSTTPKPSTALVTGAAHRLGRATALALAQDHISVIAHYHRSADEAHALVAQIREAGGRANAVAADLAQPEQAEQLFAQATALAGPIDVLVNNASVFFENQLTDFSYGALDRDIRVNAWSPLVLARCFAAQQESGSVVNFLDSRITGPDDQHAAYHLSKRMLFTLTKLLAVELAPGVRVNAVAPGLVLPPRGKGAEFLEQQRHANPLRRIGSVDGVIDAVRFLLRSDFVTGQVIFIDGGRHLLGSMYGG